MARSAAHSVLAQVTESRMRASLNDPIMARFAFAFDAVTRLARVADGFCWQLESQHARHPVLHPDDPMRVINVSVWVDYASLHSFVYRSAHGKALLRRADWFLEVPQPSTALWWVSVGAMPTLEASVARFSHLRRYGPSSRAFTLRRRFDPEGRPEERARTARPAPPPSRS